MSHIVSVKVKMNDRPALLAAIDALKLRVVGSREGQEHRLFGGRAHGIGVELEGWRFPVVINTETGEAQYDNYNGNWGAQDCLDALVQEYSVQKTTAEAVAAGYCVAEETTLENGDRRLVLTNFS